MKNTAFIGIGIPGCGKTTALKPMAENTNSVYVNRDDIRMEVTGDPTSHTQQKKVTKVMYDRIRDALQSGRSVIVDATHSRPRDRHSMIAFCREHGAEHIAGVWFDIPIDTCRQRNAARQWIVREAALFTMHHRLQVNPPDKSEGFDEIYRITAEKEQDGLVNK